MAERDVVSAGARSALPDPTVHRVANEVQLTVLVIEGDWGVSTGFVQELRCAGHEVVRCYGRQRETHTCAKLDGGECPIDDYCADVIVSVRRRPFPRLHFEEVGLVCALRSGLPLVLAGNVTLHPLADRAAEIISDAADVAVACYRAVTLGASAREV